MSAIERQSSRGHPWRTERGQLRRVPARFRTIQIDPKDLRGASRAHSVCQTAYAFMTHEGRSERNHDAPLFAKLAAAGSAGHRVRASYSIFRIAQQRPGSRRVARQMTNTMT